MQEVTGPVIAIVLVLCAVFMPVAFLGGLAGELYRQFAVTIAVSVVISGIVALTLTPALVRAAPEAGDTARRWRPFRVFNRGFDWLTARYTGGVRFLLRHARVGAGAASSLMLGATWCAVPARARQPRAGRGPGLRLPGDDAAASGVARPHRARSPRRSPKALMQESGGRRTSSPSPASICCPARRRPTPASPSSP